MDSREYKIKSKQPNAFSRQLLEKTIQLVGPDEAITDTIKNLLKNSPLENPSHYSGSLQDDVFLISIPKQIVNSIVRCLGDREAELAESKVLNQQKLSETADLLDKWNHLSMSLD